MKNSKIQKGIEKIGKVSNNENPLYSSSQLYYDNIIKELDIQKKSLKDMIKDSIGRENLGLSDISKDNFNLDEVEQHLKSYVEERLSAFEKIFMDQYSKTKNFDNQPVEKQNKTSKSDILKSVPLKVGFLKEIGVLDFLRDKYTGLNQTWFSHLITQILNTKMEVTRKVINELETGNEKSKKYPLNKDYHLPIIKGLLDFYGGKKGMK